MIFLKKFFSLCALMTLLVSCASKQEKIKRKQSELHFGAGTQALINRDYNSALTNLMKANELHPGQADVLVNLAMAYYFKGHKDLAIRSLNEALKIDSKNSDALVNLASLYYEQNKISESEKLYKRVLEDLTYDKQARTYFNLALIESEKKKNFSSAEKYLLLSIKENANYCPAHLKLGLLQLQQRKLEPSLKSLKEAASGICYDGPAPHFYQGLVLEKLGRFGEARMKFEEVVNRFPSDAMAVNARTKVIELKEYSPEIQTSSTQLNSPEF
jgi:Tfp pilus assembly protein PilF